MNKEQIEEKARKIYPISFNNEVNYIEKQKIARKAYIKCYEDNIESLPKIKGWIARNKEGNELCFFPGDEPPIRLATYWFAGFSWSYTKIQDVFPNITWESEPVKVELIINIIQK